MVYCHSFQKCPHNMIISWSNTYFQNMLLTLWSVCISQNRGKSKVEIKFCVWWYMRCVSANECVRVWCHLRHLVGEAVWAEWCHTISPEKGGKVATDEAAASAALSQQGTSVQATLSRYFTHCGLIQIKRYSHHGQRQPQPSDQQHEVPGQDGEVAALQVHRGVSSFD